MLTTTEHAAAIRNTLKREHGWTGRQVSIRAEHFSMGSAIDIVVKDPVIPLPVVNAVAEHAECISRDERTGEILGGGNRYVSVKYSHEALVVIGRRYADAIQRAANMVEIGSTSLQRIDGPPFFLGRPHAFRLTLWEDTYISEAGDVDRLAETVGGLMVARQEG